jgi:hypothetical protein
MAYEQVQKPSSSVVPVQKKVSGFAPSASRVQAKDVTASEQEQMPLGSTPATDANWLMKHPLFKGNQFLQRVVAPASESESLESEESLAQRETVQRQEEGKESGTPYSLPVQAKLTIGEPGDKYEQEADRVASQVVQQINTPSAAQSTAGQLVQRQDAEEEEIQTKPTISVLQRSPLSPEVQREAMPEEDDLQAKSILQRREVIAGGEASTDLDTAINSARGGGQPLDAGLQRSMGQAMGADFSGVKVHTDAKSDQLNQSIQAKAFTTGQDVFFRQGAYEPGSRGGQELIAHELTHVVQQNGGAVQRSPVVQRLLNDGEKAPLEQRCLTLEGRVDTVIGLLPPIIQQTFNKDHPLIEQIREELGRVRAPFGRDDNAEITAKLNEYEAKVRILEVNINTNLVQINRVAQVWNVFANELAEKRAALEEITKLIFQGKVTPQALSEFDRLLQRKVGLTSQAMSKLRQSSRNAAIERVTKFVQLDYIEIENLNSFYASSFDNARDDFGAAASLKNNTSSGQMQWLSNWEFHIHGTVVRAGGIGTPVTGFMIKTGHIKPSGEARATGESITVPQAMHARVIANSTAGVVRWAKTSNGETVLKKQ